MSDMVPEILNAALDSLFTPKEPGEREYQGEDGLLYCRNCHTPVQCRVKLWGRDRIVPCLCRCQQEAMAEKKRQDELVERQRKIRQLKATGIQEKHLLEWIFAVAEDNKDIQMAKRYVEQWKKVKAENLGLLLLGERIKELRAEHGVLQRQLAALLEIDTPMFSKIERGDRRAKRSLRDM